MNNLIKRVTSAKISGQLKKLGFTEPSRYFRDWTGSKEIEIEECGNNRKFYMIDNVNCYTANELGEVLIKILEKENKE